MNVCTTISIASLCCAGVSWRSNSRSYGTRYIVLPVVACHWTYSLRGSMAMPPAENCAVSPSGRCRARPPAVTTTPGWNCAPGWFVQRPPGLTGAHLQHDQTTGLARVGGHGALSVRHEADIVQGAALQHHAWIERIDLGNLVAAQIDARQLKPIFHLKA